MLHYTPLEERGESDSPYSIRNQTKYDPTLFGGTNVEEQEGLRRVAETLKIAREEYGLLSLTDVVLNHTANDSPWLLDHPEGGKSFTLPSGFANTEGLPQVTVPPTPLI